MNLDVDSDGFLNMPELSADELLTTTRSVRRRLDLARREPTGGNSQGAHFVVVGDAAKRAAIAALYRKSWAEYRAAQLGRVADSADFLVDNLHRVPVHVIPCIEGRLGAMPRGPRPT